MRKIYLCSMREGMHMWKFWKKEEKPKTELDKLNEKVDQTVAGVDKDIKELSHSRPSKPAKSVDDAIVSMKSDLEKIEKNK
jgi:hypothetical protein